MLRQHLETIDAHCERFKRNINDISTFYLAAGSSASLLASIELPGGVDWEMHMSDDFPRAATTIRSAEDVISLYRQGAYERLNSYQAVIGICSIFEVLIDALTKKLEVRKAKSISITSWRRESSPVKLENPTLCRVRAIHETFGIESQLGEDIALCWIYNFILLRNVVVHEGGVLKENVRRRLVSKWSNCPLEEHLAIGGNDIDDMVHFLKSHVAAFVFQAHRKYGKL